MATQYAQSGVWGAVEAQSIVKDFKKYANS